ncbi:MAG: nucleotide exchange factor GrpE [Deltaproteobacteria bacterium]|nr:nucleotide exchange factor GrpE [Myxococcales bacterium]MDP3216367.1 nucleotide exchange factor GrpE [Deltaproteobacteria bacterium]
MATNQNSPEDNGSETPGNASDTPETAASTSPTQSRPPPAAESVSPPPPADPVAVVTAERDKLKDQLLRTLADFDNYRKRSKRDEQDAKHRGREDVLRELLPVFDNLERAATYAKTGADSKAIAEGVVMVLKLFDDTIGRLGGQRLKAVGQPFDPNVHEAIQQVESDEHAAGIVAIELVPGYQLGERLLRPAMVAVSKGAPAAAPASDDDTNAN